MFFPLLPALITRMPAVHALERAPRRNLLACALWVLRFAQRDVVRAWWALLPLNSSSSSSSMHDHHDSHHSHHAGGGGGETKGDACVLQMVAFLQLCLEVFEARWVDDAMSMISRQKQTGYFSIIMHFHHTQDLSRLECQTTFVLPCFQETSEHTYLNLLYVFMPLAEWHLPSHPPAFSVSWCGRAPSGRRDHRLPAELGCGSRACETVSFE
jgi:hypothetical protein